MGKPSQAILAFMEKYAVESSEIWEVRAGGAWAIKHSALERVAAEQKITFDRPAILQIDLEKKIVAMVVFATMGDRSEWATGEASPHNNKNAYAVAMAEKRGKDRAILKLLNSHGALYSEDEAEDFKRPNPHVNKATDFHEEFTADIPDVPATKMKVKDARPQFEVLVKEMQRIHDLDELREWGEAKAGEICSLPGDWPNHFRGEYRTHQKSIIEGKAA